MGFLLPIAWWIISIVVAAAAVVATVVAAVVAYVVTAVAAVAAVIAGVVSTIVASVVALASAIYSAVAAIIGPIFTQIQTIAQVLYRGLVWYVHVLADGFGAFLEAIHFKTLLELHNIATLLSEDYRNMMEKVYGKISEVSEALGLGPHFLNLAYRNARSVVLSVSGLLGRRYDMAEIGWLSTWNDYLKKYSEVMEYFSKHPERVFDTLDRFLVKGAVDSSAQAMLTVYQTLEDMLLGIKTTASQVIYVRESFDRFVEDLPGFLKDEITPYTDPIIAKFDTFQKDIYKPQIEILDKLINEVNADLNVRTAEIKELVDRLKRPGDMFEDMRFLDFDQQIEQEDKIRNTVFHRSREDTGELRDIYLPHDAELKKLAEALALETPAPLWKVPEAEEPARPADKPVEPRKTWEVGDY